MEGLIFGIIFYLRNIGNLWVEVEKERERERLRLKKENSNGDMNQ